jgi:hypothetical protein
LDWGGGVIESARRWEDWEEGRGGDREQVGGGKSVKCGLTSDGEAAEPGAIGELSGGDETAELQCWWGAMRGGDRTRGSDITCGRMEGSQASRKMYVEQLFD